MPCRVPFHFLPKVEPELKHMLSLGIIEAFTEPTDWCASMVPVEKRASLRTIQDSHFGKLEVLFFGYIISTVVRKPDLEKVKITMANATSHQCRRALSGPWPC